MKKYLLNLLLILLMTPLLVAQSTEVPNPCGTVSERSEWLKKYQANPDAYPKSDEILYVPLTIHLLGNDSGSGYFSKLSLLDALCTLNSDFAEAEIQFFIEGDINYIDDSYWNDHESVLDGAEMMFANNVENTINNYFLSDPAGNCGYNLPYAGVAMSKGCADPQDHTWAHEIGHNLSIPHPFIGWEGGVWHDNSVQHSYNDPAPLQVLYDYTYFQDTLILDTTIIDTAYVELMDGSNCDIAADGFCDTSPDYLNYRWQCNDNEESLVTQHDPNGVPFVSDGTLIMSYSFDNCAVRFTPEQIAAMRANLMDEKPELLYNQEPGLEAGELAVLTSPQESEMVQFDNAYFEWEPVANAEGYFLQVSLWEDFHPAVTRTIETTDNFATISDLLEDRPYYWKVKAYNSYTFCTGFTAVKEFQTANLVATRELASVSNYKVFPTLLSSGQGVHIQLEAQESFTLTANLFDVSGKLMTSKTFEVQEGDNLFEMNFEDTFRGMYWLNLSNQNGQVFEKIIIQ